MQISIMDLTFQVAIYLMIWLCLNFILFFMMYFLIPKNILVNYFKKPYFTTTEIIMLSGFPSCFMRTVMFMRLLGFPLSGKKRGLEKAYQTAPIWLCRLSKYIIISFLISFSVFMLIAAIFGIHMALN